MSGSPAEPGPVALYVPGSRPDRFAKAAATGAVVVLDLEDSVAPGDKAAARDAVAGWLRSDRSAGAVQVRVNPLGSDDLERDLAALADVPDDVALRVPKVESPAALAELSTSVGRRLHVLLETALGVERAFEIAGVDGVATLGLGEADLRADLGVDTEEALTWVRSRVVVAARAAGLPAPMMAAYPDLADLDGLAASCRLGRSLGMRGRTAVHPAQVPVIREAFAPTAAEHAWARDVLAALADAGAGVARLPDGSMVDAAMARHARTLLEQPDDEAPPVE